MYSKFQSIIEFEVWSFVKRAVDLSNNRMYKVSCDYVHFNDLIFFTLAFLQLNGDQIATTRAGHNVGRYKYDRERKLGHRRIGEGGEITYKKIQSSHIMGSIQLGIQHTVSGWII